MCSIVGIFSFSGPPVAEAQVHAMCDRLVHRGPDGFEVWLSSDGRVGLGHRRLSIIDLSSAAAQPMANEDGSIQLVFNGEIFNHAEPIWADLEHAQIERVASATRRLAESHTKARNER